MKKAAKKVAPTPAPEKASGPVTLGTKRVCPKCSTRFYDFGKTEINCPKCDTAIDPVDLDPAARFQAAKKPNRAAVEEVPEPVVASSDETSDVIEDVGDLGDEDEDIVEDLVDEDDEDEF